MFPQTQWCSPVRVLLGLLLVSLCVVSLLCTYRRRTCIWKVLCNTISCLVSCVSSHLSGCQTRQSTLSPGDCVCLPRCCWRSTPVTPFQSKRLLFWLLEYGHMGTPVAGIPTIPGIYPDEGIYLRPWGTGVGLRRQVLFKTSKNSSFRLNYPPLSLG